MRTSISRGIGLAIVALLLIGFTCVAAAMKAIPPDEANPRLQTVLQELARTAQARPEALPQAAKGHGITLQADKVTVIVEPTHWASGRRAVGMKIESRRLGR